MAGNLRTARFGRHKEAGDPAANGRERPNDASTWALRDGILQDGALNRTINRRASGKARARVKWIAERRCRKSLMDGERQNCVVERGYYRGRAATLQINWKAQKW